LKKIFQLQLLIQRSCRYSSIIIFPNVIYLLPRLDMILCSVIISLKS
jgi:hypothetical protein